MKHYERNQNMSVADLMDELEEKMMNAEEAMKHDFTGIRTGKASTALVEGIQVEYYGSMSRLKDIAGLSTPDPRTVAIQPWDKSALAAIEKAIINSQLGISPVNDGKIIRLPIPPLTEERRSQLAKQVKARCEEAKVSIRNIRRDGNEAVKKAEKDSEITEDDRKSMLEDIQKLTDDYIKQLDAIAADKEKDLMSI